MKEYIEKAALLEDLNHAGILSGFVKFKIERFPAADVAEVRHGRWDENGRCTLCGGHAPFWAMASTYYKSPWCHECGARMDKEASHD